MKRVRRRDPVEHDVYVHGADHRRVIHVQQKRVCYSSGGNTNRWCNLKTFRRWFRFADLMHDGTAGLSTERDV